MSTRVSCGINEVPESVARNLVGRAVAAIRHDLAGALNISDDATPVVNGHQVPETYVLQPGEHLDFQRLAGTKGWYDRHQGQALMERWSKTLLKTEDSLRELEEAIRVVRKRWPATDTNGAPGGSEAPESLRRLTSELRDLVRRCEALPSEAVSAVESAWENLEANALGDWDAVGRQILELLTRQAEAVAQTVEVVHQGEKTGMLPGAEGKLASEEFILRERAREFLDSWPWSTGNKPGDEEDAAGARKALETLPSFDALWRLARQYPPPPGSLDEE
jgi:hypothetical protein